ncbi:MAG: hypothetical protein KC731_42590, partial [Myxococcales bacterium]|nr:hypothetical protein [Myxococcales bacterium]
PVMLPGEVWSVATSGGAPTLLATDPGVILDVTHDGTDCFYSADGMTSDTLFSIPLSGGTPAVFITANDINAVARLANDVWLNQKLSVSFIPKSGGPPNSVLGGGFSTFEPARIAVDPPFVYWVDHSLTSSADRVGRWNGNGGPPGTAHTDPADILRADVRLGRLVYAIPGTSGVDIYRRDL